MEPMILLDLPHSREYFRSLMLTTGVEPRIRYRTSNYEIVRALVAQGHGYSILNMAPPSPTTYGGGAVTSVPLLDDLPSLPIVLTRFPALRPTDRANAVAARCRAVIAAESP
jgi:DNA-binding transcriptional LysR family regulator